jgi:hypothetical protein
MTSATAPMHTSEAPAVIARIERLEQHERLHEARREMWRRDLVAIGSSLFVALGAVTLLLVAQVQSWITPASLWVTSWVVGIALLGTVVNASVMLWLAFQTRRQIRLPRGKDEYGSSAAAAE